MMTHTPPSASGPHIIEARTSDPEGTRRIALAIASQLRAADLMILDGPLGAGKTTFTQGLGEGLGVRGPVASPTFVIARVHPPLPEGTGISLVHVDAYRLNGGGDIEDLDLEAEMDRAVTVVEWGRGEVEYLSDSHLLVQLIRPEEVSDPDVPEEPRTIRLVPDGPRWDEQARRALADAVAAASAAPDARRGD